MAFLTVPNVAVRGISACVPPKVEENRDIPFYSPEEAEKVIESTGIERRHVVSEGITASDLCLKAGERLISELGWEKDSIDAILVGHDFLYRTGFNDEKAMMPDGSGYKFVIENKFVPFEYDYEVLVSKRQSTCCITPTATTNLIRGMTVNGQPVASRCPVVVSTGSPCKIVVTAPDGVTTSTYTLTFKKA